MEQIKALEIMNVETMHKFYAEGLLDEELFAYMQDEVLSYYYGFTPEQISNLSPKAYGMYLSFAKIRSEKPSLGGK